MKTAEEFFRNKIKEQNPNIEIVNLSQELITAEQGMRWAHEFKQLHLHDVKGLACKCGNQIFTHRHSNWIECTACNKIQILQA